MGDATQGATARAATPAGAAVLPNRMHHHAHVVRDQGETRRFYEDLIGLPLVATWCEADELFGAERVYCHTFYALADGSALAFFQFADEADFDELNSTKPGTLGHIALEVDPATQDELARRLDGAGVRHRLIDHGYCRSLYVLDPDGLSVEFTVDAPELDQINELRKGDAHAELERWLSGDHRPNNDWRAGH
jgi:glyoxylase I family protein